MTDQVSKFVSVSVKTRTIGLLKGGWYTFTNSSVFQEKFGSLELIEILEFDTCGGLEKMGSRYN